MVNRILRWFRLRTFLSWKNGVHYRANQSSAASSRQIQLQFSTRRSTFQIRNSFKVKSTESTGEGRFLCQFRYCISRLTVVPQCILMLGFIQQTIQYWACFLVSESAGRLTHSPRLIRARSHWMRTNAKKKSFRNGLAAASMEFCFEIRSLFNVNETLKLESYKLKYQFYQAETALRKFKRLLFRAAVDVNHRGTRQITHHHH